MDGRVAKYDTRSLSEQEGHDSSSANSVIVGRKGMYLCMHAQGRLAC
jgi:hypothetical protein